MTNKQLSSRNHVFLLLSTLVVAGNAFSQTKEPTTNDSIVAEVENVKITKAELDRKFREFSFVTDSKLITKETVLLDMINEIIGIKKAKQEKLDSDPVVRRKMDEVLYHAMISKDLEPQLKKINVSDDDVKKYYSENPEYRTAQILLRVSLNPSETEIKNVQKKALELYQQLEKAPQQFGELANKNSQILNAPNGGDIGYQSAVSLAPEYYSAIKGKKNDYITKPVRTAFGYHIIKVLGIKKYEEINMQLYKKIIYDRERDLILNKYFKDLRSKFKVKINKI